MVSRNQFDYKCTLAVLWLIIFSSLRATDADTSDAASLPDISPPSTGCIRGYDDITPKEEDDDEAFEEGNDLFQEVHQIPIIVPSADADSDRNVDNMMVQTMYKVRTHDSPPCWDGC